MKCLQTILRLPVNILAGVLKTVSVRFSQSISATVVSVMLMLSTFVSLMIAQTAVQSGYVVDGGGGLSSASDATLFSSVGQSVVAQSNNGAVSFEAGFLPSLFDLTTKQYNIIDGWNMISVPLLVTNNSDSILYPTATSKAFAYQAGYQVHQILTNGRGYWLKFSGNQQIALTGNFLTSDSISVQQGWNIIGSISSSVPVNNIVSVPGGIVTSQFFGYNNGYSVANDIESGKGYWVKVNQMGKLILSSLVNRHLSLGKIKIVPNDELPPPPPEGDGNKSETRNLKPETFSLEQNYPNPFNPTTVIRYSLPVDSKVTLKVYNTLGAVVGTLVEELQVSGFKSQVWDASGLPSGIYYYKLRVGTFQEVRKMVLLR